GAGRPGPPRAELGVPAAPLRRGRQGAVVQRGAARPVGPAGRMPPGRRRRFHMTRRLLTLLVPLLLPGPAPAENWPGWRGPGHDGVSPEQGLPTRWSATENVRWKAALPGAGVSAPAVWGERVFVTASDGRLGERLHVLCFHRDTGQPLWHARFFGSA